MGWQEERDAFSSLTAWLDSAEEIRRTFVSLGLGVPDPLRRVLDGGVTAHEPDGIVIAGPERPSRPSVAKDDWLYLQAGRTSVKVLVLAMLRKAHPATLSTRTIMGFVQSAKRASTVDVNTGSIYNALTALTRESKIGRGEEKGEWIYLTSSGDDPIVHRDEKSGHDYVWGPTSSFTAQDLALHRRDAILYLLKIHGDGGGLMVAQLLSLLKRLDWLRAPVQKDLVKMDIEALHDQIRRVSNSRKWALKD